MPITYFASLLSGGTINGPLTVTGALTTQAGIANSGAGITSTNQNISTAGVGTTITQTVDVNLTGGGLKIAEGANAKQGASALTAGVVTVANTSVTAASRILVTGNADGGTPGFQRVSGRTAGTSFTITSSSGTDTSTAAWEIFEAG